MACHATLIGTSDAIEPYRSMDELAALFDPAKISMAPARFDPAELAGLNAKLLHILEYSDVADRLTAMGVGGGEEFWLAVRGNLERLSDAADWWGIVSEEVGLAPAEDAAFLAAAAEELPPEPWDETTWDVWTKAVKARTGAKGRGLFHPLRLALTGRDKGPELKPLLGMIGRSEVLRRLGAPSA